ncbi:hypothetical protein J5S49_13435 [Virgibacillus halodenitrificans]|uniref:hypothetical protein n=1 Tax=Virgibacillus halodenitrificans TaxID=1482 RepID=UPI001F3FD81A|nr:hypothetical protein [Virgibacillus halodenitrificans]MCG1029294.1 hypothetical protein [Virgibacillus halodenitrificans]
MSDRELLKTVEQAFDEEINKNPSNFNELGWPEHIGWLIDQAKEKQKLEARVKELENLLFGSKAMADEGVRVIEGLRKENQRYKQALEFYGNEFNYMNYAEEIRKDYGKTARQALNQ